MEHFWSTLTYALGAHGPSPARVRVDITIELPLDDPIQRHSEVAPPGKVWFTRNKLKPRADRVNSQNPTLREHVNLSSQTAYVFRDRN